MSNEVASGGLPLQHAENFLLNQGVSASLGFLPAQPHFGDVTQNASGYNNKRSLSPSCDYMEDRTSENDEQASTALVGVRNPTSLRSKGIRKRYRKETAVKRTLTYLLDSLQREQILEVIEKVTEENPQLRSRFLEAIPRPTLASVSFAFSNLEKRVNEAFPFFRDGPTRDRYSFTRVKPRLLELQESVFQYADHFISAESEMPSVIFSFLKLASELGHRLPDWDHKPDNQIKREYYAKLVQHWNVAIELAAKKMEEGKLFGRALVTEWATELERHNQVSQGAFEDSISLFKNKLGWVLGVGPLPQGSNSKFYLNFNHPQ
ncbi:Tethering factor for nuclear proteasome sts1 [Entomophthora muscae]|uniref:Tethering factor for nuclear proteasome sts1 n=1 Tax=Entomophthora muscae TaxID=34485 RepID=A0ACC2SHI8_9FUNG|nr:Tethering factor for nuclear proteasome sts1 [Entomophthora muscae]